MDNRREHELEQATELLKEWKELLPKHVSFDNMDVSDLLKIRDLYEKTDRFLGKEGKRE